MPTAAVADSARAVIVRPTPLTRPGPSLGPDALHVAEAPNNCGEGAGSGGVRLPCSHLRNRQWRRPRGCGHMPEQLTGWRCCFRKLELYG